MTPVSSNRRAAVEHAGQAGVLAALIMLAVQLVWRLNWSENGVVQAFPEFIVAAISRLTPLSIFGSATENYGSMAKKTLFASVLIGIVAVGFRSGAIAGWLSRKIDRGAFGRVISGLIVATALLLFTLLVVMPIAHLGVFATDSSYTSQILTQLVVTFALFGISWAVFSTPDFGRSRVDPDSGDVVNRRFVLGQAVLGVGTAGAAFTVGVAGWRLITPRRAKVDAAAPSNSVNDIVATQRARQGNPLTPTPVSDAGSEEVAQLTSDMAIQEQPDVFQLFGQLDADGKITPVLTETNDFYHVSKNLMDPTVSKDGWSLKVTGMVNTPIELTYDDVFGRSTTEKITTLACISNTLNGDLIGTALWTGFPLKDLLDAAGVQAGAVDVKFRAADDYEDSITLERAMDPDTMVVVAMNGEPLRDDHGFPARIIVPGIYGMKNVKWLQEIEVVGEDFQGYWQTRGWSDSAEYQIWARIDQPQKNFEAGPYIATGVASAGDRDVSRVEVSLDDGATWADAILEPSINPPFTWVRWAFQFEAPAGKYQMRVRATDGNGQVAVEAEAQPLPDGATGWPERKFEVK